MRGVIDTILVILLERLSPELLPSEPLILAITLAEPRRVCDAHDGLRARTTRGGIGIRRVSL